MTRTTETTTANQASALKTLLISALAIPALGLVYLLSQSEISWITLAIYLTLAALTYAALCVIWISDFTLRIAFLVSLFCVILVLPEVILRVVDFRNEPAVSYGALRPEFRIYFEPDRELYWKHSPETPGINSLGFRGAEVVTPKPANTVRILFLGDSCTDQDFARYVETILNRQFAGDSISYECVILAAPGYSSHQGKVLAQMYAKSLEADLAFVYFGWNDHWLAYGATDSELQQSETQHSINLLYHNSRLLQLARVALLPNELESKSEAVLNNVRVSIDEFDSNINDILDLFDTQGTLTVLVTPPSSHKALGVPDDLVDQRLATSKQTALDLHDNYCRKIREIAEDRETLIIDLDSELAGSERIDEIFTANGIHYTETGLQVVGFRIFNFIEEHNLQNRN